MTKSAAMTKPAHDSALATRHADLENRIADEALRPLPDTITIAQLKKAKLKIKDALQPQ